MSRSRRSLVLFLTVLTLGVLVVDQGTKAWALATLVEGERTPVLGDLLGLRLLFNSGAAFGIANGMTWLLTIVAAAVCIAIVRVAGRLGSRGWALALGLLLGGALGNLGDRLFREPAVARGYVVDFIAYGNLFVGNVADIAIVAAGGLIMLLSLRGVGLDGTRHHRGDAEEGEAVEAAGAPQALPPGEAERQ